ncbi:MULTISPECIES: hypothetical protein [Helcococcus]|uniref:Transposase n=1 Tax=Helcococcus bovis TaxID=3153252 RepID=A0ABW9FA06_9FIRM
MKKYDKDISNIEAQIISIYSKGMTIRINFSKISIYLNQ